MDGNKTAARPAPANVRALALARYTVFILALATAADYVLDRYHLCGSQSQASFILSCVMVTAAAAAKWRALWLAMLCCAVLEAAVAALALRLPCRRRICIWSVSDFLAGDFASIIVDLALGDEE